MAEKRAQTPTCQAYGTRRIWRSLPSVGLRMGASPRIQTGLHDRVPWFEYLVLDEVQEYTSSALMNYCRGAWLGEG